jgi:hypothetical protein
MRAIAILERVPRFLLVPLMVRAFRRDIGNSSGDIRVKRLSALCDLTPALKRILRNIVIDKG